MTIDHSNHTNLETELLSQSESSSVIWALHRATLSLYSDLSLDGVLQRITSAARELVNARYAALGIPDARGGLETFIAQGMSDEEIKRIPHKPEGKGLLGEMIRMGVSIRIPEIGRHPKASGFPRGHPMMHSFLGVPITAYGRFLGQIYLTEKLDAPAFTEQDQRLIEMLAAHAAAAIENARLYRQVINSESELSQRNEELELMNSLGTAVSSAIELDRLLEIMLERVMELFEAQAGEIFLQDASSGVFRMAVHRGEAEQAFWEIDRFRRGEGFVGRVVESGKPMWTDNLAQEPRFLRRSVVEHGFNTLVSVPLTARGRVNGVLSLAFHEKRPFAQRELGLLEAVGSGVGIAAENARLYRQARRLAVLEERERIGMDLHDGIIQSIYAVGLTLDYIRLLVGESPAQAADRLGQSIDGLNAIIRDIRAYILDLRPTRLQAGDLAASFDRLVREFKGDSLVEVDLRIDDDAVAKLDREAGETLFHIAQEALANVAKHAHATKVWISLISDSQGISLQVIDNGKGFDIQRTPSALGHGMVNMAERASGIGCDYEVLSSPGEGTTITVHLPGEPDPDQVSAGEGVPPTTREESP